MARFCLALSHWQFEIENDGEDEGTESRESAEGGREELSLSLAASGHRHRYFETGLTSPPLRPLLSHSPSQAVQSESIVRSERVRSPNVSRSDYSADSLFLSPPPSFSASPSFLCLSLTPYFFAAAALAPSSIFAPRNFSRRGGRRSIRPTHRTTDLRRQQRRILQARHSSASR